MKKFVPVFMAIAFASSTMALAQTSARPRRRPLRPSGRPRRQRLRAGARLDQAQ